MKLTDIIISAITKRGVLLESQNMDVTFDIPRKGEETPAGSDSAAPHGAEKAPVRVNVKAEHVTIRIEKNDA